MERKMSEQELDRYRKLSFLARSRPATLEDLYVGNTVVIEENKDRWQKCTIVGDKLLQFIEEVPKLLDKIRIETWVRLSHEWMLENGFYDQEYYEYVKAKFTLGYE